MGITFRKETFRDDFTFKNSPEHIRRFPFPFHEDAYMYAVNIGRCRRAEGQRAGKPDRRRRALCRRDAGPALVLAEDPLRCQSLPHMTLAGWDLLELLMEQQALGYPEHFTLTRDGDRWRWINRPLGIDDTFTFGDHLDAAYGPMEYNTRKARAISASSISATAICGWMPAWSPRRRLVARFRHRHEFLRVARAGAAGA